jgi:hypothetical protein
MSNLDKSRHLADLRSLILARTASANSLGLAAGDKEGVGERLATSGKRNAQIGEYSQTVIGAEMPLTCSEPMAGTRAMPGTCYPCNRRKSPCKLGEKESPIAFADQRSN